jgi:hypothetical protein
LADIIYVEVVIAFFALALLLVYACQRVIGANDQTAQPPPTTALSGPEVAS